MRVCVSVCLIDPLFFSMEKRGGGVGNNEGEGVYMETKARENYKYEMGEREGKYIDRWRDREINIKLAVVVL